MQLACRVKVLIVAGNRSGWGSTVRAPAKVLEPLSLGLERARRPGCHMHDASCLTRPSHRPVYQLGDLIMSAVAWDGTCRVDPAVGLLPLDMMGNAEQYSHSVPMHG